jgi:hypothetical protein
MSGLTAPILLAILRLTALAIELGLVPGSSANKQLAPSGGAGSSPLKGANLGPKLLLELSAINFPADVERVPEPAGDRVRITLDGKFLPYQWG